MYLAPLPFKQISTRPWFYRSQLIICYREGFIRQLYGGTLLADRAERCIKTKCFISLDVENADLFLIYTRRNEVYFELNHITLNLIARAQARGILVCGPHKWKTTNSQENARFLLTKSFWVAQAFPGTTKSVYSLKKKWAHLSVRYFVAISILLPAVTPVLK